MRVQYSAVHERTTHFVWQCAHLKTVMELSAATQRRDIQSMACRHILYCRLVRGARRAWEWRIVSCFELRPTKTSTIQFMTDLVSVQEQAG